MHRMTLMVAWLATLGTTAADEMRRYATETCVVEYELSGLQTGQVVMKFDRWGMREWRETRAVTRVGAISVPSNTLTLLDGDWTYNVDLDRKSGTKIPTPLLPQLRERLQREGKDLAQLGREMLMQMGGKKVGDETFLEQPCEVWELKAAGTRMWLWQGVPLKTTTKLPGQPQGINIVAVKLQERPMLTEQDLALPADVMIVEGQSPLDALRGIRDKSKPPVRKP